MSIFKVNKEEKFVIDDKNNRWDFNFFGGEKEAMKAALSCDWGENSRDNRNCSNLKDCDRLKDCNNLKDCFSLRYCSNLWDCTNLENCFNLNDFTDIKNCSRLWGCSNLRDCSNIMYCSNLKECSNLRDCSNLSDCLYLRDCSNLSEEDIFFATFGKYSLTIDPEKCRGGCTTKSLQEWLDYEDNELSEEDNDYLQNITKPTIRFYLASRK